MIVDVEWVHARSINIHILRQRFSSYVNTDNMVLYAGDTTIAYHDQYAGDLNHRRNTVEHQFNFWCYNWMLILKWGKGAHIYFF